MDDFEYANAYSEVLAILEHISLEEYNKIPKTKLKLFEKNCNKNYEFKYDPNKTLREQNVCEIARTIIAILFRDYWATDEQKRKILIKERYDNNIENEIKKQKYNSDNIFKKKKHEENIISNNLQVIEYKESIFNKILYKIKSFFIRIKL